MHPFPSLSSSQPLQSISLLSISIPILSFHSISSFPFICYFSFDSSFSCVLWYPALHYPPPSFISSKPFLIPPFHPLHPVHIVSSLLFFVSLLWDLYHVCFYSPYRIIICCVDRKHSQSIRRNRLCSLCMIREQRHRMMRKWENEYLRIGGNRCSRSSNHRSWFHQMIIEGYLNQSNAKSILSRITEPILWKLYKSPLNSVNEERSIHSSAHSISLRIVNVLL